MRLLAIDYGTKNTGFAIGEEGVTLPLPSLKTSDTHTVINHIKKVVDEENVSKIILGIPNYKDSKQKKITESFKSELEKAIQIPTENLDESGTSKEAFKKEFTKYSSLKKLNKKIHSLSAEEILKRYYLLHTPNPQS